MIQLRDRIRKNAARLAAIALVLALCLLTIPSAQPAESRVDLARQFRFDHYVLPTIPGQAQQSVRHVAPSLERIRSWISSVGAGVALGDLDRNGLPDDSCLVDPRTNTARIAPVPGTGARYRPFDLHPEPLRYDATMAPMGCLMGDLNEDGHMDLLVYYWGRTPIAFLHTSMSDSPSAESYTPCEVHDRPERWFSNAATLADLDGDGHLDLVIGNYFPDSARVLDVTADGEQMQRSMSRAYNGGGPRFLRLTGVSQGPEAYVRFQDVREVLPTAAQHGWTLAVGAADLDGDLLPEVYLANDFGPDRLLRNLSTPGQVRFSLLEGKPTFTSINSNVIGRDSFKGMGVDIGDFNGDGHYDMLVSNIANPYALIESHFAWINTGEHVIDKGVAPFTNKAEQMGIARSGWGWDIKAADFNNDGALEIYQATGFLKGTVNRWPELQELATGNDELLGNPDVWPQFKPGDDLSGSNRNPFFTRGPDGRYIDIAPELGLGESQVSRGIAIADVDGDGLLDFAVANQWGNSSFYHNTCANCGRFLSLDLLLPLEPQPSVTAYPGVAALEGRPAVGAAVTLHLPDGRVMVAQVDGGNGHSGKRSPGLHFGLGDLGLDQTLRIALRWRDGQGRVHHDTLELKPGKYTIRLR